MYEPGPLGGAPYSHLEPNISGTLRGASVGT